MTDATATKNLRSANTEVCNATLCTDATDEYKRALLCLALCGEEVEK